MPDRMAQLVVAVFVVAVVTAVGWSWERYQSVLYALYTDQITAMFLWVGQGLVVVNLAAVIWRVVLVLGYRPHPVCSDGQLPEITVVVPAFNEGQQVLGTLRSLVQSDYPAEKLNVIAVDDGSTDDTWLWLQRACRRFPGRIQSVHCKRNRGKRLALYEGFVRSRGRVLVTVDSDSEVEPQTLRRLVSPFVHDGRIGAVAGNVRVLNRAQGIIPRLLDASFTYSFDFIRASQSRVNTVMCTPGALSAYRRDVALRVLPEWLEQTFCGRPANIGEDRALTNLILRSGLHVTFQRNAVVYTQVPTQYRGLCRMLLRWQRSNVRETLVMCRFAFRRFRSTGATGARINLLLSVIGLTLAQLLWVPTVAYLLHNPAVFGLQLLFGATLIAIIPALVYALTRRSSNAVWAFPYALVSLMGLAWITPYALGTPHRTGWLTR